MIPIRCISCGKPVSAYFDEYQSRLADGEDSKAILDDMGITRITEAVIIDYDSDCESVTVSTDYGGETEQITMPYIQFEKAYEAIKAIRATNE